MNKNLPLVFFFLFSCILLFTSSANAATVFGPQDLTINRWHYHYSYRAFMGTDGEGQLVLTKTASTNTIKSGFIFYNFRVIPLDTFLRGNQETLTVKIGLHAKNRLLIFFRGTRGASLSVKIEEEGSLPEVVHFTAVPATIAQGEPSTLTWSVSHAELITVEPEIGTVEPTGSFKVSPRKTTEYTLTASGVSGTARSRANVIVTPPKPTVTITAEPDTIAPGTSSTLAWNSEHAEKCTIEPDIGVVATNGSKIITPQETTTYTITAVGSGGSNTTQVLVQVYPIKVVKIDRSQAHYKTPENTSAASTSALLQQDIDWYYQTFTDETAAQDKNFFENAGIDIQENFNLSTTNDEEFIIGKSNYKDGILLFSEIKRHDIDGTVLKTWSGFVMEDGLWKVTYKFTEDTELLQFNDVIYTNCIASYKFSPADFLEDSCWHGNDLTNFNETGVALDKRYEEDLTTAVFNGIDNGLARDQLNDMPVDQFSIGGWIKADNIDHTAGIIEIGRDREDSTAIVLDPGNGLRYWIHVNGKRVERKTAIDYDFHDNQWHHVYLTYDGALMQLYVDAQLKDTHPVAGPIDSAPILNIGQRNAAVNNGTANTFKGRLDDIQVYNKALTADEIMRKYENGTTQVL